MPFSSMRQNKLHLEILEALEHNAERKIAFLESQWVHRYGLTSLPKTSNRNLDLENLSTINEENKGLFLMEEVIPEEILNQKNIELTTVLDDSTEVSNEPGFNSAINQIPQEGNDLSVEKADNSVEGVFEENTVHVGNAGSKDIASISPPPPPTLKHLRRWLPAHELDLPQAS